MVKPRLFDALADYLRARSRRHGHGRSLRRVAPPPSGVFLSAAGPEAPLPLAVMGRGRRHRRRQPRLAIRVPRPAARDAVARKT